MACGNGPLITAEPATACPSKRPRCRIPSRSMAYSRARRSVRLAVSGRLGLGIKRCTVGNAYGCTLSSLLPASRFTSHGLRRSTTLTSPRRRARRAAADGIRPLDHLGRLAGFGGEVAALAGKDHLLGRAAGGRRTARAQWRRACHRQRRCRSTMAIAATLPAGFADAGILVCTSAQAADIDAGKHFAPLRDRTAAGPRSARASRQRATSWPVNSRVSPGP